MGGVGDRETEAAEKLEDGKIEGEQLETEF
jgi:hypothetical protein